MANSFLPQAISFTKVQFSSPTGGSLDVGSIVAIGISLSTPVSVTGIPTLILSNGALAGYDSANSTADNLVFHYTVGFGEATGDLRANGISFNGGSFTSNGVTSFLPLAPTPIGVSSASPIAVIAADFNGDGLLDLAVADQRNGVEILQGDGTGAFKFAGLHPLDNIGYPAGAFAQSLAVADFNSDGSQDLAIAAYSSGGVDVLLGNVESNPALPTQYFLSDHQSITVTTSDINGDGKPDLIVAGAQVHTLLGVGDGTFGVPSTVAAGSNVHSVLTVDVNNDGNPDLLAANNFAGVSVLIGDGKGGFSSPISFSAGKNPVSLASADLNRDGNADLIVADFFGGVSVLLGDGVGGFGTATSYAAGTNPWSVAVSDLNGDGAADLVVAGDGGTLAVLLGDGHGSFGAPMTLNASGSLHSVITADVNGDGRPDVVTATGGNILIALNESTTSGSLTNTSLSGISGADSGIAVSCFCSGSRIRTQNGIVAVEQLAVGDLVSTAVGMIRPIAWIGQRTIDLTTHPEPHLVQPIRICANAIAPGTPCVDLRLSPDHAVLLDGVLVAAHRLVNGRSIVVETVSQVTYWHIELESHDILLAEGMPVESYLDTGNRHSFEGGVMQLHADFTSDPKRYETHGAAPLVTDPDRVRPIWLRLDDRSRRQDTTESAELTLVANGQHILPDTDGSGRHWFTIPPGTLQAVLTSRSGYPSDHAPWAGDRRRLGVSVRRILCDGQPLGLNRLGEGWYPMEREGITSWRWTNGAGILEVPIGTHRIEVLITSTVPYRAESKVRAA